MRHHQRQGYEGRDRRGRAGDPGREGRHDHRALIAIVGLPLMLGACSLDLTRSGDIKLRILTQAGKSQGGGAAPARAIQPCASDISAGRDAVIICARGTATDAAKAAGDTVVFLSGSFQRLLEKASAASSDPPPTSTE